MDSKRVFGGDGGIRSANESCAQTLNYLKSKFCMTRLVPNIADSSMQTLISRRTWSGTELRKDDFCPFMLWVTLPRDYVEAMVHQTLEPGWNFGKVVPEMAYMGEHQVCFSPSQHFCYILSMFQSLKFTELFICHMHDSDFEKHRPLLDSSRFGKIGSRTEGLKTRITLVMPKEPNRTLQ